MRSILSSLEIPGYGPAGGAVAAFWLPHSWRAFLPSALEAVGAPPHLLSWLSAWRPQSGTAYIRTQREKTRIMQATVARIVRAHLDGDDPIGETASLSQLEMHLGERGFGVEEAAAVCAGMRKFMGPPVDEILWPQVREDDTTTVEAADRDEVSAVEDHAETSGDDSDLQGEGEYVISISDGRRVRRLHRLGLCHRRPGLHYHRYERCGATLPPPSQYNDYCRDCWKKDGPTTMRESGNDSDTCGGSSSSTTPSSSSEHAASSHA